MQREARRMVLAALVLAAWTTGPAAAQVASPVLSGVFTFEDAVAGTDDCTQLAFQGIFFEITGTATGIGLESDTVTLSYDQDFPDAVKVKAEAGQISQRRSSELLFVVVPGLDSITPPYTGLAAPERCSIAGKLTRAGAVAKVRVRCELGPDLAGLVPKPDGEQLKTILAAFDGRKDVRFRGNNVQINVKGVPSTGCP